MNTTVAINQTVNTTDIRFNLGKILTNLEKRRSPILIISRSKPKAWLYPYETQSLAADLFLQWQRQVLPKYQKIKTKDLLKIIRSDRDQN